MSNSRQLTNTAGKGLGLLGTISGAVGALYLLIVPTKRYGNESGGGSVSGIEYVLGNPHADAAMFLIPLGIFVIAIITGYNVWNENVRAVWVIAIAFTGIALLSIVTIGPFLLAFALLLLASSIALSHSQGE